MTVESLSTGLERKHKEQQGRVSSSGVEEDDLMVVLWDLWCVTSNTGRGDD